MTEGDLPAVATGSAAAAVTASEMAFEGKEKSAPDTSHLDKGMHSPEHYKAECEAAGKPEKWQESYRNGWTSAAGWKQPTETRRINDFKLNKGFSASEAIENFLKGPTICDYRVALLADEIDEVRDELGDIKFDKLFGSKTYGDDEKIPMHQRLHISSDLYTTPLGEQMKAIAAEYDARDGRMEEPETTPRLEARVEEKPQEVVAKEQDPLVVAQELGVEQRDREIV